jgi:hypothetical protein
MHAQRIGEPALTLSRDPPKEAEHPGLGWRELQRPYALGESGGSVRPELSEQKGDTAPARRFSLVGRTRTHEAERLQRAGNKYN